MYVETRISNELRLKNVLYQFTLICRLAETTVVKSSISVSSEKCKHFGSMPLKKNGLSNCSNWEILGAGLPVISLN